jgi:hypothetical protein
MSALANQFPPQHRGAWSRRDLVRLAGAAFAKKDTPELATMPPADEASRDPALAALLGKVRRLAGGRDSRGLEALMLPTFRVEFDAGKGPAAFRRRWNPESPSSALWDVLERLFSLGGTFYSDTLFGLPYVCTQFPLELDPLGYVVAVKAGARLLDRPGPEGAQVAMVDYAILPLAQPFRPPVTITSGRYFEVKLPRQGRCFAAEADVYNPAAHRAFFEKRQRRWRWISLVCATLAEPPDLKLKPRRK